MASREWVASFTKIIPCLWQCGGRAHCARLSPELRSFWAWATPLEPAKKPLSGSTTLKTCFWLTPKNQAKGWTIKGPQSFRPFACCQHSTPHPKPFPTWRGNQLLVCNLPIFDLDTLQPLDFEGASATVPSASKGQDEREMRRSIRVAQHICSLPTGHKVTTNQTAKQIAINTYCKRDKLWTSSSSGKLTYVWRMVDQKVLYMG